MKKKITWAAGALCLILMIAGASVLYGKLAGSYKPDQLAQLAGDKTGNAAADKDSEHSGSAPAADENSEHGGSAPAADEDSEHGGSTPAAENEMPSGGKDEISASEAESEDEDRQQAPDFTAINYDGEEVSLSDYFGKPIVLNFWASWCPPCKAEMPDFDEAYKNHPEIQFLMVNMTDGGRETVDTARKHVEDQEYGFPVLFDTELSAAEAYYVSSIPATYFIDGKGRLVAYASGMIDAETLARGISMITEEEKDDTGSDL